MSEAFIKINWSKLAFWRKEKARPWGRFIAVDFTHIAKTMGAGGMRVKKIYHIFDDGSIPRRKFYLTPWARLAFDVEDYDPIAIQNYKEKGIPIIDYTDLVSGPVDASQVPVVEQALDKIEWSKIIK